MIRTVRVVNMTPQSLSGDTNQDSEPQLAVNSENTSQMAGTAFTPDPGGGPNGPIYVSVDGGDSWSLNLIVPGGEPNDQSVRFGGGSTLYAGVLRGDVFLRLDILRTGTPTLPNLMTSLVQRDGVDQPYVGAIAAAGQDKLFVGNNDSRGASVDHSADARTAAAPAGISQTLLDPRRTIRDSPSIRPAAHADGTVYAAYFSWRSSSPVTADVVVARDDAFATGGTPFTALTDPGDAKAGVRVALAVPIPWFMFFGNQRVGSSLSIAVDPSNSSTAYLAWGDGPAGGTTQTTRVRRSTDRGATWSGDLVTLTQATNPALAITGDGRLGLLYQQLVALGGGAQRWRTHVQVTSDAWATPADDILLADTPVDTATYVFDPYLGDYADLIAIGHDLYGVFCAHNQPDTANFPNGVVYNRNHDFGRKVLLANDGVTVVNNSIDPFFFHISWRIKWIKEIKPEIKELKYEKLEIKDKVEKVEIKEKVEKIELKEKIEHKENIKQEIDHKSLKEWKEKDKDIVEGPGPGPVTDPYRAIELLAERIDDLEQRIATMRSFITPEERPNPGQKLLDGDLK